MEYQWNEYYLWLKTCLKQKHQESEWMTMVEGERERERVNFSSGIYVCGALLNVKLFSILYVINPQ